MTKIIFLDIDGVLNCETTKDVVNGFIGLCDERIERLNRITAAHSDAYIVISSTWRKTVFHDEWEDFDGLIAYLVRRGIQGPILDHTPITLSHLARGHEIRRWLVRAEEELGLVIDRFVILDDDGEAIANTDLEPHWVQTEWDGNGGLQAEHVERAIELLK